MTKRKTAATAMDRLIDLALFGFESQSKAVDVLVGILESGDAVHVGDAEHELRSWRGSDIERFRREVESVLRSLTGDEHPGQAELLAGVKLPTIELSLDRQKDAVVLVVDGSARDVLWFQAIDTMRVIGLGSILRCPYCDRVFVRRGKQEFCTTKCGTNTRAQTFYKKNRETVLEKRHASYKREVQAQQPKAKVERRARVQGGATEVKTGGLKAPEVSKVGHKKARQSTKGISGL